MPPATRNAAMLTPRTRRSKSPIKMDDDRRTNTVNEVTNAMRTRLRRGSLEVKLIKVGTARSGSRMTATATKIFMYSVIESINEIPAFRRLYEEMQEGCKKKDAG